MLFNKVASWSKAQRAETDDDGLFAGSNTYSVKVGAAWAIN